MLGHKGLQVRPADPKFDDLGSSEKKNPSHVFFFICRFRDFSGRRPLKYVYTFRPKGWKTLPPRGGSLPPGAEAAAFVGGLPGPSFCSCPGFVMGLPGILAVSLFFWGGVPSALLVLVVPGAFCGLLAASSPVPLGK